MTDRETIQRAIQNDQSAFEELFNRFYNKGRRVAYSVLVDWDATHDLVTDVLIKCWSKLPGLNPNSNLDAYVMQAIAYRCYDWARHLRIARTNDIDDEMVSNKIIIDEDIGRDIYRIQIIDATRDIVGRMGALNGQALALFLGNGGSALQIAKKYDLTRASVKSRLFRARQEFRSLFHQYYPHLEELIYE